MKVGQIKADQMGVGNAKLEVFKVEMGKIKVDANKTKVCQSCCPNVIQED